MPVLLLMTVGSYGQLVLVLLIFAAVLGVTAFTTKWIAQYQKEQGMNANIQLLDATQLGNNKYIQIVRIGNKYYALAVCKDSVTMLGEISKDELVEVKEQSTVGFKTVLAKTLQNRNKDSDESGE